ncbi:MAG: nuclear transport factor 2 family protein [Acidobacteriota bacterium]
MHLSIYLLIMLVVLNLTATGLAEKLDQPQQESEILAVVERWWNGWATRDIRSLEEIADENFIEFTGSGSKRSEGKTKLLETAKAVMPLLELEKWQIKDAKVIFHGDTAVCNYYFWEKSKFNGKEYQISGCATDIFIKKNGKWKMISHHGTHL